MQCACQEKSKWFDLRSIVDFSVRTYAHTYVRTYVCIYVCSEVMEPWQLPVGMETSNLLRN